MADFPTPTVDSLWQQRLAEEIEAFQEKVDLTGDVLILSDRLACLGIVLQSCLGRCTSMHTLGVASSYQQAMQLSEGRRVRFLILAGYQWNASNYLAAEQLLLRDHTTAIMWATEDSFICDICREYHIEHLFNKFHPIREFLFYLQALQKQKETNANE